MKSCLCPLAAAVCALAACEASAAPLRPHGFPATVTWGTGFAYTGEVPGVGDFNGDGIDDIVTFYRSTYPALEGDVMVSLNTEGGFGAKALWHPFFGINNETTLVGDFNGDGRDDITTFLHGTLGRVYVALSTGSSFATAYVWSDGIALGKGVPCIGDFNGDGKDDVASYDSDTQEVKVALSTGGGFTLNGVWASGFFASRLAAGDFNKDGKDDLVGMRQDSTDLGTARVLLSNGSGFAPAANWTGGIPYDFNYEVRSADLTADGLDDLILVSQPGELRVLPSEGSSFYHDPVNAVWNWKINFSDQVCLPGHFNRDLNDDLAVFFLDTASGRVKVSLAGGHAQPDPTFGPSVFGYGAMGGWILPPVGSRPPLQEVPMVLGVFNFGDRLPFGEPLGRDVDFYDNLYFGPAAPNVRDWFLEMSEGRFTFSRAGVYSIEMAETPDQIPDPANPGEFLAVDARVAMVQAIADAGFDFRAYDADSDGTVRTDELCIALVSNYDQWDGLSGGWIQTVTYPSGGNAMLSTGVTGSAHLARADLYIHEASHLLGTVDLYSSDCYNEDCTLMHCNAGDSDSKLVHLDAWHKMMLGWKSPTVYNLSDGPGQISLTASQAAGANPVLLYDLSLGIDQYYLLEYRSPNYPLGEQIWGGQDATLYRRPPAPAGGYPHAGYDSDFAFEGVAPWFVQMKSPPTDCVLQNVWIGRGENALFDSIVAGDDAVIGNRITTGPDNILQTVLARSIKAGANGTLESSASGDDVVSGNSILPGPNGLLDSSVAEGSDDKVYDLDVYGRDEMVFLSHDPAPVAGRGSSASVLPGQIVQNMQWLGGENFSVHSRAVSPERADIAWGEPFRPYMESWPTGLVRAGTTITVEGGLGPFDYFTFYPVLRDVSTGETVSLEIDSWSPDEARIVLPSDLASGDHVLYFRYISLIGGSEVHIVSNTVPIDIESTYIMWLGINFTAAQINDPAFTGLEVDLDGDGLGTIGEYASGGNPWGMDANRKPFVSNDGFNVEFRIPLLTELSNILVQAEYSTDMQNWSRVGLHIDPSADPGIPGLSYYCPDYLPPSQSNLYLRVVYTLVTR